MPETNQISLQSIADEHISRLLSLRDGVELNHIGLLNLNADAYRQYVEKLPPRPRATVQLSAEQMMRQAMCWMAANALRDVLSLDLVLFEQIRLCIELSRIGASKGNEKKKQAEAKKLLEGKIENLEQGVSQLERLLIGGFPRKAEIQSLERLFRIFAGETVRQPFVPADSSVEITLCVPELTGQPDASGNIPFQAISQHRIFPDVGSLRVDKELIYAIFFTAFTLYRELVESCKATILEKYPNSIS